ncbi:MAG: ribosomal L7Ae/L30e/S12e/Gadd45 family protein [Clostridia bacterium]|nr:ribosomal L7Ae/L30e/S12e/Gadd45 family protein [Clostridia bacterium]
MRINDNPLLMTLGLSKKAGKLICGTPLVCRAIAGAQPPSLVVMSAYASDNTRKKIKDKCTYYDVRLYELDAQPEDISRAIGGQASVAAVAICDGGLGRLFMDRAKIENRNEE